MGWWNRFNIKLVMKRIDVVDRTVLRHYHLGDRVGVAYLQLKKAQLQAEFERRTRREAIEFCRRHGCDMQSIGGANCGCIVSFEGDVSDSLGCCSVPVMECTRCGDCDYGENEEARETRKACADRRELYGLDMPVDMPVVDSPPMRRSA